MSRIRHCYKIKLTQVIPNRSQSVLDLDILERQLTRASMQILNKPFHTDGKGLSGLVQSIFGLPLDKRDQLSDWDKRPLTNDQFLYAALDAYVLVELYNELLVMAATADREQDVHKLVFFQFYPLRSNF